MRRSTIFADFLILLNLLVAILIFISIILGSLPVSARQVPQQTYARFAITQRAINEVAAPVEMARRALLEEAGLRRPGEGLSVYVRRIALPLSGESNATYKKRIARYLTLLADSAKVALMLSAVPALHDTSAANKAQWDHLVHVLPILQGRVHKTEVAWQQALKNAQRLTATAKEEVSAKNAHFDTELEETMQVVLAASNTLRDARP